MPSNERFDEAVEWFKHSLDIDRVAHAYVVVGDPRGDAREFALRALGMIYSRDGGRLISPEIHPDIIWIEPRKKSRIISIEQIREVQQRMAQTAFVGGWKACVLVAADRLGPEASNAFLKTLEEPRGKSIFLLLTDSPEALLPTIASRCQRITLSSDRTALPEARREELMGILAQGACSTMVSSLAQAKRLMTMLEEIKKTIQEEASSEPGAENEDEETMDARVNARYREVRTAILRLLLLWHRDILMCVCGADDACLHFPDYAKHTRARASALTYSAALRKVNAVETMRKQLDENLSEMSVFNSGFGCLSIDC